MKLTINRKKGTAQKEILKLIQKGYSIVNVTIIKNNYIKWQFKK